MIRREGTSLAFTCQAIAYATAALAVASISRFAFLLELAFALLFALAAHVTKPRTIPAEVVTRNWTPPYITEGMD